MKRLLLQDKIGKQSSQENVKKYLNQLLMQTKKFLMI